MKYSEVKEKLLSLFEKAKMDLNPDEWGFFNESEKEIKRIGYATNISPEIILYASSQKIDLLLTHHDAWDFIFGLREKCNKLLFENNIAHGFFHGVLDDADFGTNASLAKLIHLKNYRKVMPYANGLECGIIGELEKPLSFEEFSLKLSEILDEPVRQFKNNNKPVNKICIAVGGGNMTTEMKYGVEAGCDTYITGEYVLYSQQYAQIENMNLFVGSHTRTEIFGVKSMTEKLAENTDLEIIIMKEPNY